MTEANPIQPKHGCRMIYLRRLNLLNTGQHGKMTYTMTNTSSSDNLLPNESPARIIHGSRKSCAQSGYRDPHGQADRPNGTGVADA
jgi:hypothetical protein